MLAAEVSSLRKGIEAGPGIKVLKRKIAQNSEQ